MFCVRSTTPRANDSSRESDIGRWKWFRLAMNARMPPAITGGRIAASQLPLNRYVPTRYQRRATRSARRCLPILTQPATAPAISATVANGMTTQNHRNGWILTRKRFERAIWRRSQITGPVLSAWSTPITFAKPWWMRWIT